MYRLGVTGMGGAEPVKTNETRVAQMVMGSSSGRLIPRSMVNPRRSRASPARIEMVTDPRRHWALSGAPG